MLTDADKIIQGFLRKRGFPTATSFDAIEMPTTSQKRPRRSHKAVSFSNLPVVHVLEYSEIDLGNSWYGKSDYMDFANECRRVLRETDAVVGEVQKIDASEFCVRGLEDQIIPSISQMKRKRKRVLIKMIIRQHRILKKAPLPKGPDDWCESIREISVLMSSRSRKWARELGVLDANR